jgi:TPR repeat protein
MACDKNDFEACFYLATLYLSNGSIQYNQKRAAQLYIKSCKGDYGPACEAAAMVLAMEPTSENQTSTTKLFNKGCTLGDIPSCVWFGTRLDDGSGIKRDRQKAFRLYQKACNARDGWGCQLFAEKVLQSSQSKEAKDKAALSKMHEPALRTRRRLSLYLFGKPPLGLVLECRIGTLEW